MEVTYVFVGEDLPGYGYGALKLANRFSGVNLQLVGSARLRESLKGIDVQLIPLEDFYDPEPVMSASNRLTSSSHFRNGFWRKTLERLFVLEQYMRVARLDRMLHAELDQLLFRVDVLAENLEAQADQRLFIPFQDQKRAVGSILYCNDLRALSSVTGSATDGPPFANEMSLLARWATLHPTFASALPTIASILDPPFYQEHIPVESLSEADIGGVVDAIDLGLWVGGIDPRNVPPSERPSTKYIDASGSFLSRDQLESLQFELSPEDGSLFCRTDIHSEVRIFNLHLHSKVHSWLSQDRTRTASLIHLANADAPVTIPGTRNAQMIWTLQNAAELVVSQPKRAAGAVGRRLASRMNQLDSRLRRDVNQRLGRRPSSAPFLSGDTFRAMADHVWEGSDSCISPSLVRQGDVVFCQADQVDAFVEVVLSQLEHEVILLLANSDTTHDWASGSILRFGNVARVFAQNLAVDIPGFAVLPIGLENAWRSNHGRVRKFARLSQEPRHTRLHRVMWTFSTVTNPKVRSLAAAALHECTVADSVGHVSPARHRRALGEYAFVASPPGNGLDTHRTWEAMYLGCIPIVQRSFMTEQYEEMGLPVVIVDSFVELEDWSEEWLRHTYDALAPRFASQALWSPFWGSRIDRVRKTLH